MPNHQNPLSALLMRSKGMQAIHWPECTKSPVGLPIQVRQWSGGWATKTLPADTKFVSFFATFAVEVTATMLFIFNISTIVIYSFFIVSGNAISNVSSNLYAE